MTAVLFGRVLPFLPDPLRLWEMTAEELFSVARAGERLRCERQRDTLFTDRLLAFNTAALTRTAVNAPERFPESPESAFPNRARGWREAKAEMGRLAEKFREPRPGGSGFSQDASRKGGVLNQ